MTFGTLSQPAPVRRATMVGRATRSVVRSRHIRAEPVRVGEARLRYSDAVRASGPAPPGA